MGLAWVYWRIYSLRVEQYIPRRFAPLEYIIQYTHARPIILSQYIKACPHLIWKLSPGPAEYYILYKSFRFVVWPPVILQFRFLSLKKGRIRYSHRNFFLQADTVHSRRDRWYLFQTVVLNHCGCRPRGVRGVNRSEILWAIQKYSLLGRPCSQNWVKPKKH